jgi:RNA polymerase sigma factor (sigma-70 family)
MSSDDTRWTLIERAAAGSLDGRTEFARRYSPVIRAYLGFRWRGTPLFQDVEDAAQQVFIQCFKDGGALGRADPARPSGFRAYLHGVVQNVALSLERKRARSRERQPESAVDLADLASRDESSTKAFDRAWARAVLGEAADLQLARAQAESPEAVRRHELLGLRFGDDLPIREIARRWNVDPAVLHREYARAREEFRLALRDVLRARQGRGLETLEEEIRLLRASFP